MDGKRAGNNGDIYQANVVLSMRRDCMILKATSEHKFHKMLTRRWSLFKSGSIALKQLKLMIRL